LGRNLKDKKEMGINESSLIGARRVARSGDVKYFFPRLAELFLSLALSPSRRGMKWCSAGAVLALLAAVQIAEAQNWVLQEVLDRDAQFTLSWNPQLDSEGFFHFNLRAATKGFLGFGISDTGTMAGSDLVVAWPEKGANATVMVNKFIIIYTLHI